MIRKVLALILAQLLIAGVAVVLTVVVADVAIEPAPLAFVLFAVVLFALLQLPPIYVEFRRHGSLISITDGIFMVGLVALGPLGSVLAVGLVEAVNALRPSQPLLKRGFNLVSLTSGAAVGALAYASVGGRAPLDPSTWVGAVLAAVVIALWDTVMTALVLTLSEGERLFKVLREVAPPQAVALGVAIPFGLIALILYGWAWPSLLLLVPILTLLHLTAQAALRQRADRQRVQQLADASARLVELDGAEDVLTRIARRSRELVTAASAVAVAVAEDGTTTARVVDDAGERETEPALLDVVLGVVGTPRTSQRGELATSTLSGSARRVVPPSSSILWVVNSSGGADELIVAAFRELSSDGGDVHRADVLATFVTHAATALVTARLHAHVRDSLDREQAFSRRKDEFVATVSHELRTPLTSIGGAIETLRHRGDRIAAADRDKLLDLALDHSGRLRGLIDDLLLVAEGQVHRAEVRDEPVDLVALLDGLVDEFRPWMQDQLSLRSEVVDRWVVIDGDRVRRILAHLLDNARKYAAGSAVEVVVTQRPAELVFVVRDGGPGIAPGDRDEVFERFVQLDSSLTREHGGLGLGLHLCRQLATALGGEIRVDDDLSGGARFTLRLPVGAARSPRRDEPSGAEHGGLSAARSDRQAMIDQPTMGPSEPPRR